MTTSLASDSSRGASSAHSSTLLALLLILALIWFGGLDHRKLIKPDEGRYAEISREMAVSGDWLTPRLNDLKYFEKPPLQYWATAAAYEAFGANEGTARLWTALTGFLGILLAGMTAARLYDRKTGLFTAAVLGSSFLYVALGHINALDMALSFFMSATLFCTLLARADPSTNIQRRWMLTAWAAMALAVLSKGLIGIVLPGAVLVLYLALSRDWALLKRLEMLRGSLLFLLIVAPWFVLVSIRNPEFARFFFIHEHFERFLTNEHRREGAWWYFVPILVLGLLPWLSFTFMALLSTVKAAFMGQTQYENHHAFSNSRFKPELLLLIWSVFIFVFFSLSGSKLPAYILPIFPALALLTALRLREMTSYVSRRALFLHLGFLSVVAVGILVAVLRLHLVDTFNGVGNAPSAAYLGYQQWLIYCLSFWLLGLLIALFAVWRQWLNGALLVLAFTSLLTWSGVLLGHEQLRGTTSAYDLAQAVKPELARAPAQPFYSIGMYDQTLNFYLNRTVTLVNHRDEMDFGLTQEPEKWVADIPAFAERWSRDPQALAIMAPDVFAKLRQIELPLRVVFQDTNRIVIAKPAQP